MLTCAAPPRSTSARAASRMRRVAAGFASVVTAISELCPVSRRRHMDFVTTPVEPCRERLLACRFAVNEPDGRCRSALLAYRVYPARELRAIGVRAVAVEHFHPRSARNLGAKEAQHPMTLVHSEAQRAFGPKAGEEDRIAR